MHMIKISFFLLFILLTGTVFAAAKKASVANYTQLAKLVSAMGSPRQTLLVLDDDDTLTMMPCPDHSRAKSCQYLGGPAWFAWQQSLPANSPSRISPSFDGLLQMSGIVFSLSNMPYTEKDVPTVLQQLGQQGVSVLVETARSPSAASATTHQLTALAVGDHDNLSSFISAHALRSADSSSLASPFLPCRNDQTSRMVTYQQGVLYVAGQNKGEMLKCLLSKTQSSQIKNIVFIDDTQQNIDDVYRSFVNSKHYHVLALHYNGLDAHKAAFTQGKMAMIYQHTAAQRWSQIKAVMQQQLVSPALPGE